MIIIWDIDGTICDSSHRMPWNPNKRPTSEQIMLDQRVEELYLLFKFLGSKSCIKNIILTARSECDRNITVKWLKENGFDYDDLITNDKSENDVVFKTRALLEIKKKNKEFIIAIDDRDDIVEAFRDIGICTLQFKLCEKFVNKILDN
jgi:hypothetical protein